MESYVLPFVLLAALLAFQYLVERFVNLVTRIWPLAGEWWKAQCHKPIIVHQSGVEIYAEPPEPRSPPPTSSPIGPEELHLPEDGSGVSQCTSYFSITPYAKFLAGDFAPTHLSGEIPKALSKVEAVAFWVRDSGWEFDDPRSLDVVDILPTILEDKEGLSGQSTGVRRPRQYVWGAPRKSPRFHHYISIPDVSFPELLSQIHLNFLCFGGRRYPSERLKNAVHREIAAKFTVRRPKA